jgi:hypothetical protein
VVEWLKVKALSSNLSTAKKKKCETYMKETYMKEVFFTKDHGNPIL